MKMPPRFALKTFASLSSNVEGLMMADDLQNLGSLAQSARGKQLKSARNTLIAVGVLTALLNFGVAAAAGSIAQGNAEVQQMIMLSGIGFGLLGVVFIVLGVMVNTYPVPCTMLGLVLYIGANAVSALIDPTTIAQGIIIKGIIIVGLVKSLRAAQAYQQETNAAAAASDE